MSSFGDSHRTVPAFPFYCASGGAIENELECARAPEQARRGRPPRRGVSRLHRIRSGKRQTHGRKTRFFASTTPSATLLAVVVLLDRSPLMHSDISTPTWQQYRVVETFWCIRMFYCSWLSDNVKLKHDGFSLRTETRTNTPGLFALAAE
jgi:hypothetical protein